MNPSYLSRMTVSDADNSWFRLAADFVNNSNRHIFLTGKAGTGKTTFLKYIQQTTFKKTAVVAPTGVAAINAGGVTMHSFFQLPFGPFVPGHAGWNSQVMDSATLFQKIRFNQARRDLLRELELLIIDEVSMVRADMLDATDAICRHFRRRPYEPFGGLQVLYIGDLFQLPPVVNEEEWKNILSACYKSPFFFDSRAVEETKPLVIELKKIYRQEEETFISILNNIRNNEVTEADLDRLHEQFDRSFEPPYGEHYILLTTHNSKADAINQQELKKTKGELFRFEAVISGDFNEKSYPADKTLQLKAGAQVMFIKNDRGEARRYYNGKLATVSRIDEECVFVVMDDDPDELEVEMEEWKNIRYQFDAEKDRVEEETLGTFSQYPLRLAWAITIHKSQGLTFEKAIIDAGASFAPGQVYVALSRLTTIKGLVLYSRIHPNAVKTDERVLAFVNREMDKEELEDLLKKEQLAFVSRSLAGYFNWEKITGQVEELYEGYEERLIPDKQEAEKWAAGLLDKVTRQKEVADKFRLQLEKISSDLHPDYAHVRERTAAATGYFTKELDSLLTLLEEHTEEVKIKKRVKKYLAELGALRLLFVRKQQQMKKALALANALSGEKDMQSLMAIIEEQNTRVVPVIKEKIKTKPEKGESRRISLQLFKEGKTIAEIAGARGFALSTIEGHLASFIPEGEIGVEQLLPPEKIQRIEKAIQELGDRFAGSKEVKDNLPPDYSYADIRAVMLHLKMEK